jgi:hypothetical protein
MRTPSSQTAPQARQKEATASGTVTRDCSLQAVQVCRSSSANQARKSAFVRAVEIVSPAYARAGWTTMGRSAYLKVVAILD